MSPDWLVVGAPPWDGATRDSKTSGGGQEKGRDVPDVGTLSHSR